MRCKGPFFSPVSNEGATRRYQCVDNQTSDATTKPKVFAGILYSLLQSILNLGYFKYNWFKCCRTPIVEKFKRILKLNKPKWAIGYLQPLVFILGIGKENGIVIYIARQNAIVCCTPSSIVTLAGVSRIFNFIWCVIAKVVLKLALPLSIHNGTMGENVHP